MRRQRRGFTLIELMIVIVIILILIGLLVPAISGAMRNAREGQVKQEIGQLDYAISDFNATFGMNPPSYIDLRLYDGTGPTASVDAAGNYLRPATQSILMRLWPNLNINPSDPASVIGFLKANPDSQRELDGSACLVFFLGGMVPSAGEVPSGFANNPRSPFSLTGARVGPFFEFRKDRLVYDKTTPFKGYDGYLDSLPGQQKPYWYITHDRYVAQEAYNARTDVTDASKRPVYRQSANSFFSAQKYQIVSPGPDGVSGDNANYPGEAYGIGGIFDEDAGVIRDPADKNNENKFRKHGDADNITSFHTGRLLP